MLLQQWTLRALSWPWQEAGVLVVVAACVLALLSGGMMSRIALGSGLLLPVPLSLLVLRMGNLWWAPAAALGGCAIAIALAIGWRLLTRRRTGIDVQTGLVDSQRFRQVLQEEWTSARRTRRPLAMVLIDVEGRAEAPEHSPAAADGSMLTALARLLDTHARRPRDVSARLGGSRLALLLPDTHADGVRQVLEALIADAYRLPGPRAARGRPMGIEAICWIP